MTAMTEVSRNRIADWRKSPLEALASALDLLWCLEGAIESVYVPRGALWELVKMVEAALQVLEEAPIWIDQTTASAPSTEEAP